MRKLSRRTIRRRRANVHRVTGRAVKKRETRQRILASAKQIARREGLRAASVPRVMTGAGLTVGGFYAHFDSKTLLDAEVVRTMLVEVSGKPPADLAELRGLDWLSRVLDLYLHPAHRDNPNGCPYPSVLSEIARAPDVVRRAFSEAFEVRVKKIEAQVPATTLCTVRERALATVALAVGGLLLSRAAAGDRVSDEILVACRKFAVPEAGPSSTYDSARFTD